MNQTTSSNVNDSSQKRVSGFSRFFRYRLRTLLLIVTIFGVFVGPELSHQLQQRSAANQLRDLQQTSLAYDYDLEQSIEWPDKFPPIRSKLARFFRRLTGSDLINPVVRLFLSDDSADSIQLTAQLRHLKWLQIAGSSGSLHERPITSLTPLENCTQLEYLVIGGWLLMSPNGSDGFRGTGQILLPYDIDETNLKTIGRLKKLRVLAIGGQCIDNESLQLLSNLNSLEYLYLSRTSVSASGIEQLRQRLPNVKIVQLTDPNHDYSKEINSRF